MGFAMSMGGAAAGQGHSLLAQRQMLLTLCTAELSSGGPPSVGCHVSGVPWPSPRAAGAPRLGQEGDTDPSPPARPRPLRSGHREGRAHPAKFISTSGHPVAIGRERPGAGGQENDLRSAPAEPSEGEGASAGQASGPCQLLGAKPSCGRGPARVSTGMLTGPQREGLATGQGATSQPGFPAVTPAAARGHRPLTLGYDLGCLLLGGADAGGEGEAAGAEQLG